MQRDLRFVVKSKFIPERSLAGGHGRERGSSTLSKMNSAFGARRLADLIGRAPAILDRLAFDYSPRHRSPRPHIPPGHLRFGSR